MTFQVFDAQQPEAPGQTLLDGVEALNVGLATFSANGRFVASETYEDGSQYHVFDVESGDELDVTEGCSAIGTNHSRFIGPWIGQSSIALMLDCPDGQQLLVREMMPGGSQLLVAARPPTLPSAPGPRSATPTSMIRRPRGSSCATSRNGSARRGRETVLS